MDPSLLGVLPPDLPVVRTRHVSTRAFYEALGRVHLGRLARVVTPALPLMEAGWVPFAFRAGRTIVQEQHVDLIYSSAPPMSCHVAAGLLSRAFGVPWVADFRDDWSTSRLLSWPSPLHERAARRIDRWVMATASRVVVTSSTTQARFESMFPGPLGHHVTITNGFEEGNFEGDGAAPDERRESAGRMEVVYAGRLGSWRRPETVLGAVERLIQGGAIPAERIRLTFVGHAEDFGFPELEERGVVRRLGYVAHDEAVAWMKGADVLLLLNGDPTSIPGKLFEYLGARRPILAVMPRGAAFDVVEETGAGVALEPGDSDGIERELLRLYREWGSGTLACRSHPERVARYSRKETARQLATVFDETVREATTRRVAAPAS
jgi:glycosyltransferase involved in cell wall biosynthesis